MDLYLNITYVCNILIFGLSLVALIFDTSNIYVLISIPFNLIVIPVIMVIMIPSLEYKIHYMILNIYYMNIGTFHICIGITNFITDKFNMTSILFLILSFFEFINFVILLKKNFETVDK